MPTENNTGLTWNFEDVSYFLRDDEAAGICDYERYSLFRDDPDYQRISIRRGALDKALPHFCTDMEGDRFDHDLPFVNPTTVFLDERGQA